MWVCKIGVDVLRSAFFFLFVLLSFVIDFGQIGSFFVCFFLIASHMIFMFRRLLQLFHAFVVFVCVLVKRIFDLLRFFFRLFVAFCV